MNVKRVINLILILLASAAWGQNNSLDENPVFDPESLLVDVRTPSEYVSGHIKNAVNIPLNQIAEDIKYFAPNKEKTIVIYCESGNRVKFAEKILKDLGYRNVINAGKYKDLKKLEAKLK